jgi:hypothetical protein
LTGLQLSEHIEEPGDIVFRHACKLGYEGIVSKRLGSAYVSGRSRNWLKFKNPAAPAGCPRARKPPGTDRLRSGTSMCCGDDRRTSPFLRCEDGWFGKPARNPKKTRAQSRMAAPWVTGRARGSKRGRWAAGCFHNAPSARWFLSTARRKQKENPGTCQGGRGSPASQGDDSASDFDPQGRTGPRYDRGELSNRARANVADSREDRRKGSGPIQLVTAPFWF